MGPVAPGDVLAGKYRVTKVLGVGGMGVVVAAEHIQLNEKIALKFMLSEALQNAEAVERFLREARAVVKLQSEHVARVRDIGTLESGAPYIVMEYLEGADLAGVLTTRGPLPPEEAVEYILHACDALAEAHALGIIHRDLKPANLFLTRRRDGTPLVKVLDFGISKSTALNEQGTGSLTKTGGIMGSPLYMSPEQMKSAKDTDARTDIWSLGVILYELLGGRPPFDTDTLGALMALILTEPPAPLEGVRPGLPPTLYAAIGKCLEKNRDARWPTVAHFAAALSPSAPARARPLIERISIVLGQPDARASNPDGFLRTELKAGSPSATTSPGTNAPAPNTVTAQLWSSSVNQAPAKKSNAVAVAVSAVVVAALIGFGVWKGTSSAPTPQVAAASTAPPPATSEAPSPPPPPAQPPTTASAETPAVAPTPVQSTATPPTAAPHPAPQAAAPVAHPTHPPPAHAAPATAQPNCNPPYTVDSAGHKSAKPECM